MLRAVASSCFAVCLTVAASVGNPSSADDFDRIVDLRSALEVIKSRMDGRWLNSARLACYGQGETDKISASDREELPEDAWACTYFDKFKNANRVANIRRIQSLCSQATVRFGQLEEISTFYAYNVLNREIVLVPDENAATAKDDELEGAIREIADKIDEQIEAYRVRGAQFVEVCEKAERAIRSFLADPVAVDCPVELVVEIFNFELRADQGCRVERCLPIASDLVGCARTAFDFSGNAETDRYQVNAFGVADILEETNWDSSCIADSDRWAQNQCDTVN